MARRVAAISLNVASLFSTGWSYWSALIKLSGPNAGTGGGVLNMAGNLGGAASTASAPYLVHFLGWEGAIACTSVFAFLAAASWLMVRPGRLWQGGELDEGVPSAGELEETGGPILSTEIDA